MSGDPTRGSHSRSLSFSDQDSYENAVIRVGGNFQADLPLYEGEPPQSILSSESNHEVVLWRPIDESLKDQLEKFIRTASEEYSYTEEQALALLTWHQLDFDEAVEDLCNYTPIQYEWSNLEREIFFTCVAHYNKQFHKIKKHFPNRTVNELILFYYSNKRNQQALLEMGLNGSKWSCLQKIGHLVPGISSRMNNNNNNNDDSNQKYDFEFDMNDPLEVEVKRYLDMMHGIVPESAEESIVSTEQGTSLSGTQSECETETHTSYSSLSIGCGDGGGGVDGVNIETVEQHSDQQSRSSLGSVTHSLGHCSRQRGQRRRRYCRKAVGSKTTRSAAATASAAGVSSSFDLFSSDIVSVNRLSARKFAQLEKEISAAIASFNNNTNNNNNNNNGQSSLHGVKSNEGNTCVNSSSRSSRRGILCNTKSRATLPSGIYYSHREFLRFCDSTPAEREQEMDELNTTIQTLSEQIEKEKKLAESKSELLKDMEALRPPSLPIDPYWSTVDIQLVSHAIGDLGLDYEAIAERLINKTPSMVANYVQMYGQYLNLHELASLSPMILL
uniref:SANT domain-containing protein n=1 Tax=Trichobilharzia regenti TaxID=157069 RepID=A0AA85KKA3_TRIRE|nr:unnamed protein product [Trichobilharzia regenti]